MSDLERQARAASLEGTSANQPEPTTASVATMEPTKSAPHRANGRGHDTGRLVPMPEEGYCQCGCGELAPIATRDRRSQGHVRGRPVRFIRGHNKFRSPVPYLEDENGCWIWQRGRNNKGYGLISEGGKTRVAHRDYFIEAKGPIPEGMEIDHICRVRACVNPDHLRLATRAENQQNRSGGYGSSRFRGVQWSKSARRWVARVRLNGKGIHLGTFQDEEEAARVAADWRAENMPFSAEARAREADG